MISIHAPSRERLLQIALPCLLLIYFNPRSLTGATILIVHLNSLIIYFNPRSLTGATLATLAPCQLLVFQSTLPHGSDFKYSIYYFDSRPISIHAPSRERL